MALSRSADELHRRGHVLRQRFNTRSGTSAAGSSSALDGHGGRVDALTTNPGHALWTGIADAELADRYLDRLVGTGHVDRLGAAHPRRRHGAPTTRSATTTGRCGRTTPRMCAAGAARYGRWDIVDQIVDGAFDAASEFARPPARAVRRHRSRGEAPIPVAYPSSCSPQAWSSASILMLLRTLLDLTPSPDRTTVNVRRADLTGIPDLRIERLRVGDNLCVLDIHRGNVTVRPCRSAALDDAART